MASNMGPPLSPREPRRSGRRSAPSSSSASKSTSPGPPEPTSAVSTQSASSSHGTGGAGGKRKRVKEEDVEASAHPDNGSVVASGRGGKKGKRKSKKEVSVAVVEEPVDIALGSATVEGVEDEDGSFTRCVCGSTGAGKPSLLIAVCHIDDLTSPTEDEEEQFGFWIQCDTCKAWQHGQCVGFARLENAPANYFCEQCRPDLHPELMKSVPHQRTSSTSI